MNDGSPKPDTNSHLTQLWTLWRNYVPHYDETPRKSEFCSITTDTACHDRQPTARFGSLTNPTRNISPSPSTTYKLGWVLPQFMSTTVQMPALSSTLLINSRTSTKERWTKYLLDRIRLVVALLLAHSRDRLSKIAYSWQLVALIKFFRWIRIFQRTCLPLASPHPSK